MFLFVSRVCGDVCVRVLARARVCVCKLTSMCMSHACSSAALAVGVSVIISTSVAMETISVTLIGFITRRVGTC